MIRFAIFSTDIDATLNPWEADPPPAVLLDLAVVDAIPAFRAVMAQRVSSVLRAV